MPSNVPSVEPNAVTEIRRGATRLARRLRAERPASALSANKLAVLGHLHTHGSVSPGAIAEAERQQPQSLTRVLAELEQDGLIDRSRSAVDGRSSILSLTAAGRDALTHDMAERDTWLAAALSQLTDVELELLRLGAALMNRIAESDVDAPAA
jgi:DNA-binding MarR family transcriptional regulator